MKQEPVAWISKYSLKDIANTWELTSLSPIKDDYFDTPLYTAPKQLSADDIHHIAKQFLETYETEEQIIVAIEDWYGFARAILKKASEK